MLAEIGGKPRQQVANGYISIRWCHIEPARAGHCQASSCNILVFLC